MLNTLDSEDRGLKVRFSLAMIAFDRESAQMSQILSSQGKKAPSNPYPHYLDRNMYHHRGTRILADPAKAMVDMIFLSFPGFRYLP